MSIKIEWLGHACFKLTFGDWQVVLDPYEDGSVPGLGNMSAGAMEVLCSHEHHDHNARNLVRINRMYAPAPEIVRVATYHDDAQGAKRGENIVHIFNYNGLRVAHFGDLGHPLTDRQAAQIGKIDIAMIPVGGHYTIDAGTAFKVCGQIGSKTVIPMHYRTPEFGFDVIGGVEEFTSLCDKVVKVDGDTIEIEGKAPEAVFVLKPHFLEKA